MPQLDFLIILPQIFWLILCFTIFYFLLTYYFLPFFLKTIKARINFIKINKEFESNTINLLFKHKQDIFQKLNILLYEIRVFLFARLLHLKFNFVKKPFKKKFLILNKKIFNATSLSFFFCNPILLSSLKFYPLFLNKKS
uniref:ATP synthase F0 subunit 8 n=1 Tax=Deltalsia parasitica TaxID=1424640 RepID=UPI0022FD63C6|nr:ATP synthase F0 subunit 8 [Deltalsia parasitica]WAX04289.1 ATP synthase F0 subunit 8 [Deltalsia parasitica]